MILLIKLITSHKKNKKQEYKTTIIDLYLKDKDNNNLFEYTYRLLYNLEGNLFHIENIAFTNDEIEYLKNTTQNEEIIDFNKKMLKAYKILQPELYFEYLEKLKEIDDDIELN